MKKENCGFIVILLIMIAVISMVGYYLTSIASSSNSAARIVEKNRIPKNEPSSEVSNSSPESSPSYFQIVSEILEKQNVTVMEIAHFGSSNSLASIGFNTIDELIELIKLKNITVIFYYRGRILGEGLLRHFDNWFFLEGNTIYYHKKQYYFGP